MIRVVTAEASRFGMRLHLVEDPVHAHPHDQRLGHRIEMHVARAVLGRLQQYRVDELDEGGVREAVVGLEVGLLAFRKLFLEQGRALPGLVRPQDPAQLDLDVLPSRNGQVDRVARRETQLVHRLHVGRVRDRHPEPVSRDPVGQRTGTGEQVPRDQGGGAGIDALLLKVDERQPVLIREHPRGQTRPRARPSRTSRARAFARTAASLSLVSRPVAAISSAIRSTRVLSA